jgi:rhodanese-related sulfurtransferase
MAFIGVAGGLVWTLLAGRTGGVRRVHTAEATRLINSEDAAVVDVRTDAEFRNGHIINAINVPEKQLDTHADKLEKLRERPVVMVCRTGQAAARVSAQLRKKGFQNLHILDGGLMGWQSANLPLAKK